jgi:hypothetical protein
MEILYFTVAVPRYAAPTFLFKLGRLYEQWGSPSIEKTPNDEEPQVGAVALALFAKGDEAHLKTVLMGSNKLLNRIYLILAENANRRYSTGDLAAETGASKHEVAAALSQPTKLAKALGKAKVHSTDVKTRQIWVTAEVAEMLLQALK